MTLIAIAFRDGYPAVAVGDLLLSRDGANSGSSIRNILPFQIIKELEPVEKHFSSANIVGFTSKMITFGSHMILWAGSYLLARSLIDTLYLLRDELTPSIVEKIYQEIISANSALYESSGLSLIYARQGEEDCVLWWADCEHYHYGDSQIIVGGSGIYQFINDFERSREEDLNDLHTPFRQISSRIQYMTHLESHDPEHYWFGAGGGYEFAFAHRNRWIKAPYNITYYIGNSEGVALNGVIALGYIRDHLVMDVHQVSTHTLEIPDEHQVWAYMMQDEIRALDRLIVADPLGRNGEVLRDSVFMQGEHDGLDRRLAPEFTLLKVFRDRDDGPGLECGMWSYIPAVYSLWQRDGGWASAGRAFVKREVEEYAYRRKFICPPHEVHKYEAARAEHSAGIGTSQKLIARINEDRQRKDTE